MKICILGNVTTSAYYGGTANFNEELAQAFHDMGHSVVILTLQKDAVESPVVRKTAAPGMRRALRHIEPELIIASLAYGRFLNRLKDNTVGVYYLHGFFNFESYGVVRTLLSVFFQKWIVANADLTIANSSFTAALNRRMWKIRSDGVASPGVSQIYADQLMKTRESDKEKTILFVGRLVKSKGIDRIIAAFRYFENSDEGCGYRLKIVGDGPLEEKLRNQIRPVCTRIDFLGKTSKNDMYKLYRQAKVFISLNETEPYGIVFLEALLAGCKIVCPNTGGQLEFLRDYPESVAFVNPYDPDDIQNGMRKMLSGSAISLDYRMLTDKFSYVRTAEQIMSLVNGYKEK